MTIRVRVIGIGTGDPDQLTRQAVRALNEVDVFLVADKGPGKRDLAAVRSELCQTVITHERYRIVEVPDPDRGPDADRTAVQYERGVEHWHRLRAERYAAILRAELGPSGTAGFLVWGDPALYDSTIRIVEQVRDTGLELQLEVVPGISSVQLLAARHQIVLNRVGQPLHITTGRRLVEEYSPALGDVVVMLDGELACGGLVDRFPDLWIYWGAQLGLPDEALLAGRLADALAEIRRTRAALRADRGWVMDTYLLRPGSP